MVGLLPTEVVVDDCAPLPEHWSDVWAQESTLVHDFVFFRKPVFGTLASEDPDLRCFAKQPDSLGFGPTDLSKIFKIVPDTKTTAQTIEWLKTSCLVAFPCGIDHQLPVLGASEVWKRAIFRAFCRRGFFWHPFLPGSLLVRYSPTVTTTHSTPHFIWLASRWDVLFGRSLSVCCVPRPLVVFKNLLPSVVCPL